LAPLGNRWFFHRRYRWEPPFPPFPGKRMPRFSVELPLDLRAAASPGLRRSGICSRVPSARGENPSHFQEGAQASVQLGESRGRLRDSGKDFQQGALPRPVPPYNADHISLLDLESRFLSRPESPLIPFFRLPDEGRNTRFKPEGNPARQFFRGSFVPFVFPMMWNSFPRCSHEWQCCSYEGFFLSGCDRLMHGSSQATASRRT